MPRKKKTVMPSAFMEWLESRPKGSIMRPETFAGIVDRQFKKLQAQGVPDVKAHERAKASAGSAYWRAATKKYILEQFPPGEGKVKKQRRKKNPVLAVMGNPGKLFSRNVHSIAYTHTDDGEDYIHEFAGGVQMRANGDGSIAVFHPKKSIWREFK